MGSLDVFMNGADDILDVLKNAGHALQNWGSVIVFIAGTIMVIAAVVFIAKGLMSQGRSQTNWALTIILLVLGGVFMATSMGGWNVLKRFTNTTTSTLNEWTDGAGNNWENADAW